MCTITFPSITSLAALGVEPPRHPRGCQIYCRMSVQMWHPLSESEFLVCQPFQRWLSHVHSASLMEECRTGLRDVRACVQLAATTGQIAHAPLVHHRCLPVPMLP